MERYNPRQVVELSLNKRNIALLKANKDSNRSDLKLAKKIDEERLHKAKEEDIIRMRKLIREVGREIHKMKGFVRLKHIGKKLKFGYIKPEHEIGEMVTEWFANRFPGIIIVLGNEKESWISIKAEEKFETEKSGSLENTVKQLSDHLHVKGKVDFGNLWEKYYESQYSDERKNKKLFKKNMPEKFRKRAENNVENRFKNKTLEEFRRSECSE